MHARKYMSILLSLKSELFYLSAMIVFCIPQGSVLCWVCLYFVWVVVYGDLKFLSSVSTQWYVVILPIGVPPTYPDS